MQADIIFDTHDEALVDPLANLEVEFPLFRVPFPALGGLDVLEEACAFGAVARDPGGGKGVVGSGCEEMGRPFRGGGFSGERGSEGSVLEFEDLYFASEGCGGECDCGEGGDQGVERGGWGGKGDVEEHWESGGLTAFLGGGIRWGEECFLVFEQPGLDGRVAGEDESVANDEEDEAPGEDVGAYEEDEAGHEEIEKNGGGEDFVGEVGCRSDQGH